MSPDNSNVTIRYAAESDIPRLVDIAAAAFNDHPFYVYIYPGRKEHPTAWRDYWHREIVTQYFSATAIMVVAEEKATGTVLSFAIWLVFIEGYTNPGLLTFGNPELLKGYPGLPNENEKDDPAQDLAAIAELEEAVGCNRREQWNEGNGPGSSPIPHWWLRVLATDPQHQGRGMGTRLMDWGCDKANSDGVVTGLYCSSEGLPYYLKSKFVKTGELRFGPLVAPVCVRTAVS
ncbi:acyl-CoA N-acyltransferase [Sphaerosporella brunnea]|uniref:Acyl-CoA N-acyltransferase n=1 Tax=Sphaerosporella brunnea TaxID=1250544 RepID=A0A5J5FAU9_9PEZI|nr:acyl-CoA N-acyltransferase [Sphaerosporella brunnea]